VSRERFPAVDPRRFQRYADKVAHGTERLDWFSEWKADAGHDARSRLAAYKALEEAVESFVDISAMVMVDCQWGVKDDATNILRLAKAAVVPEGQVADLLELNGLRNLLIHEYDGIDDARALEAGERLAPALREALEEVRTWMSTRP
jgi:uncharacterized protein YutE (UPF0331/DUF86 family)